MDEELDLHPRTPLITQEILDTQPKTEDPYEIDLGHYEMSEDESNDEE